MNEEYIKKLISLVEESQIESLEVSRWWGRRVKIVRRLENNSNGHGNHVAVLQTAPASATPEVVTAPTGATSMTAVAETKPVEDTSKLVEIKSPMVGTYYAAPKPEANPYVSLNQKVSKGQVVCIVEAMKLMNEIESEFNGRIAKICIENAQPVEFGQPLFFIEPD